MRIQAVAMVKQLTASLDLQLGPLEHQFDVLLCPTAPGTAYR